jgi:hypothetical protein
VSCRDCTPNILCGDSIIEAWWQIPRDKGAPFFHSPIASSLPAGSCNSKGTMRRADTLQCWQPLMMLVHPCQQVAHASSGTAHFRARATIIRESTRRR